MAANEIQEIVTRWELSSYRQLSELLHINRRTLAKLAPRHPDGSLKLETLDCIYARLLALCPEYFPRNEQAEERLLLVESRIRILMCLGEGMK